MTAGSSSRKHFQRSSPHAPLTGIDVRVNDFYPALFYAGLSRFVFSQTRFCMWERTLVSEGLPDKYACIETGEKLRKLFSLSGPELRDNGAAHPKAPILLILQRSLCRSRSGRFEG